MGKESGFIYSTFIVVPHTQGAQVQITVLTANYTVPAFTRWRLPRLRLRTSNCSLLLIYLPRKDERLSRPDWLTYSRRFTTWVVTRQLQVERGIGQVRRSKTEVVCHATKPVIELDPA